MANEKRLIDANKARVVAQRIYSDPVLIHAILNTLDETPTVDAVEVVHGHWTAKDIINRKAGYGQRYYYHEECKGNACQLFECPYNYCPNCGADMRGETK